MMVRDRVLEIAFRWIGTPYRHQASREGVGCDCLGIVRGIWREIYGGEPEIVPPYAQDWAERSGEERLLDAAARHFRPAIRFADALPGDLLLFRWKAGHAAKHAGILAPDGTFIHAYEQAAVVRSALTPGWARRIAAIHSFPEI